MHIEVKREYLALDFDRPPLEVTVWQQTGPPFTPPPAFDADPPHGYTPGLLRGYIDGRGVSLDELMATLWPLGR